MKNLFYVLVLSTIISASAQQRKEIGNLAMEGIPDIPLPLLQKLDEYTNVRSAVFSDWAPGGNGILISTRFGDVTQLHHVPGAGMDRRQLTFFKEPIANAASCPDAKRNRFLFQKDQGGNENYQLLDYDMKTGKYVQLSDGKSRHDNFRWSKKGDRFAFTSNKRNGKDNDIYVYWLDKDVEPTLTIQVEGGGWSVQDWSRDDSRLIIKNYISVNESHLFVFDLANSRLQEINPSEEKINYGQAVFAADGKGIFFVSDQGSDFSHFRYYNFDTGKITNISADISWDVEGFEMNHSGDLIAFECNVDGYSELYIYQVGKKTTRRVMQIPKGSFSTNGFHPSKNLLAFTMSTFQSPGDVYVLDVDQFMAGKKEVVKRWTFSETGNIDVTRFSEPETFRFPTFDISSGTEPRMIPCLIYKPKNSIGKFPVVINIHGGPEGQSKPGFSPLYQFLANELGIAVLVPNVRGSTGYGKTYVKLDNGFKREDAVKDIGSLLDWIGKQPFLDSSKVAVWGGSYGGYMTLACMTTFNNRLKAGIDVVGISNFVTFLKNTSDYRRDLRRVEYGDERDPQMREFLEKISPNNNVHKITKPMFIVQGLNDPRVPVTEAEQMVDALKKKGNTCWYLLGKDEGHGFKKKTNNDFYQASLILFLQSYLLK